MAMGRGILHGHEKSTGAEEITKWKLKCIDFVALQAAYLRLYIDSFGSIYKSQLDKYIPFAFSPKFDVHSKLEWKKFSQNFEPILSSLRYYLSTITDLHNKNNF